MVRAVVELLSKNGETMEGFSGSEAHAEAEAILRFDGKPYCVVTDWILVEVEVPDGYQASLAKDGLSPYVLYASRVVTHSAGKRQPGDWVRSTFQRSFTEGCWFETRNTHYMLVGPGLRKKTQPEVILAIVE